MVRRTLTRSLLAAVAAGMSVAAVSSASAAPDAAGTVDHLILNTKQVAVAPATVAKPKPKPKPKPPFCKKGQKSTKKKPCRKRKPQVAGSAANPPVAGWTFGMTLTQRPDGTWGLALAYNHRAGNTTEFHTYLFSLTADAVSAAQDLSMLTIDTGTQLGQFGSVKLTLSNVGAPSAANPLPGCTTGTWQTRSGTLSGALTFVADGTYFKTVKLTSLPADLTANTSGVASTCGTPPATCSHVSLIFGGGSGSGFFEALSSAGQTTLLFVRTQNSAPATITDFLQLTGLPASDLTVASDVSTGAVATDGASPSFTGSLSFARTGSTTTGANAACGGTPLAFAQGALTGNIAVHFLTGLEIAAPLTPATGEVL